MLSSQPWQKVQFWRYSTLWKRSGASSETCRLQFKGGYQEPSDLAWESVELYSPSQPLRKVSAAEREDEERAEYVCTSFN